MTLEQWRAGGRTSIHRAFRIFHRSDGLGPQEGTAVLCLHGYPGASADWRRLWPLLTRSHRAVAADMIGFGFSDKPVSYDYSIHDQATLQENLMATLGVRRVHVLAHDYGVSVAQEMLARFEDRRRADRAGLEIASLCFLNGAVFPELHRALPQQRLLASPLGVLGAALMPRAALDRSLKALLGAAARDDARAIEDWRSLVDHNRGWRIQHRLARFMDDRIRARTRWVGVLEETSVPLGMINGVADPVCGRHVAEAWAAALPEARLEVLDDIGHYPAWEAPSAVFAAWRALVEGTATDLGSDSSRAGTGVI